MKRVAIGVDIGGSSIKLGVVGPGGKIILRDSFLTPRGRGGRKKLLNALLGRIRGLRSRAARQELRVTGVGVGAPGPIHIGKGLVYFFPNIPYRF